MMNGVRLGVFAAMSVDGYLADSEDGLDFLAQVERRDEDYGYMAFASRVKGYVVGRRTFDIVSALCGGQFPHEGKWPCFVLTRTPSNHESTDALTYGTVDDLLGWMASHVSNNSAEDVVWCDGGGQSLAALAGHIDEWTISVIPTLLGSGIPLFPKGRPPQDLESVGAMTFDSGLVQMRFQTKTQP